MPLSSPAYRSLATMAARRLGAGSPTPSPAIVAAILAQWSCELGRVGYPPTRNNPGNVAEGWARGLGYQYTVRFPNPQPGNPIVTFASPTIGANCYADGLAKFSRYSGVRAAARAGDGAAFLRAVTAAKYGTRYSCAIAAFLALGGKVPPNDAPAPPGYDPAPVSDVQLGAFNDLVSFPVGHVLTDADVDHIMDVLDNAHYWTAPGSNAASEAQASSVTRSVLKRFVKRAWTKPLQDEIQAALGAAAVDANSVGAAVGSVGQAIAGLPDAIGTVLRSTGLFVGLLALVLVGLYLVARGR